MPSFKDISIIIPVYNAGAYFPGCLDSVLAQTIDRARMEVILVDDGSTDGSSEYCDEIQAKYPELFRVIHRPECSGHSSIPRNEGFAIAQGEYVLFFDADDLMMPEACQRMVDHAREWGCDMLNVPTLIKRPGEKGRIAPQYAADRKPSIPDAFRFSDFFVNKDMSVRRLFSRSLVADNKLAFCQTLSEEILFATQALMVAKKCSMACDYIYFHYLLREDAHRICSPENQPWSKCFDGRMVAVYEMLKAVDSYGHEAAYPYLYRKIFGHVVYRLLTTGMDQRDWQSEIARLPELREAIKDHWNMNVAATLNFTERAVIESLMAEKYGQLELIRSLGKASVKPKPNMQLVTDAAFEPACLEHVVPELADLSAYVLSRLVRAQLCSVEVKDFNIKKRLSKCVASGRVDQLGPIAHYSAAELEFSTDAGTSKVAVALGDSGDFEAVIPKRAASVQSISLRLYIGEDSALCRLWTA